MTYLMWKAGSGFRIGTSTHIHETSVAARCRGRQSD